MPASCAHRILIVGCGFLGGHLAAGLARRGSQVRVLSRSFARPVLDSEDHLELVAGDARDPALLDRALSGVDEVICCIGGLQPASAESDPLVDRAMIIEPLEVLLAAMLCRPRGRLIFMSSGGAVYGNPLRLPVEEDHPLAPIGAYGAVRAEAERMILAAVARGEANGRILRCANVYGEHQPLNRGQGAVGVFIDRISRGRPVQIYGDGSVVRDFVYVGDLVDAMSQLCEIRESPTVINVGSGTGTSVRGLIAVIEAATGHPAVMRFTEPRPFDVGAITLDIKRLRNLIAFAPTSLDDGVQRLLDHYRTEPSLELAVAHPPATS
jgi:UDP-glucose 4-epimerase